MLKEEPIPVHRMADEFAGVYVAPFGGEKPSPVAYESAQPHRHDFYYCVLLEKGSLEMDIEWKPIQLPEPSLYLSYPGQVHQVRAANLQQGWYFAFAPSLIDEALRDVLDQFLSEVILVPLTPAQAAQLALLLQHLRAVQHEQPQPFRQPVLQHLVTAFGYQLAAAYLNQEQSAFQKHTARSIEITKSFKQLLRQQVKQLRKPTEFAAQLHLSVSHLNDTVRAVTGFSVTYYIQQALMREAQRLLAQSGLTVQEVAYALGFEDAKYFNRLFRKVLGISPGMFKKQSEAVAHW